MSRVEVGVDINLRGNLQEGLNQARGQIGGIRRELSDMEKLGRVMAFSSLSQGLGSLSRQFDGASSAVKQPYINFEREMIAVKARISGISDATYSELKSMAKRLGATTRFTQSEIAQGMNKLVMAGFNPDEIKASIADVTAFVQANDIEFGAAADIATDIGTAFQYKAADLSRVMDVLTLASNSANTDITMLGETMAYAAAEAHSLGVSLEETTTMAAVLANAGIKGSMAGTTLKETIKALAVPDDAALKVMDRLKIKAYDDEGKLKGVKDLLLQVSEATADMTDEQKAADLNAIFKERGSRGILTLLSQGQEAFEEFLEGLEVSADGTVRDIAQTMAESMAAGLAGINSRKEALFTTITEAGYNQLAGLNQLKISLLDTLNDAARDNNVLAGRLSLGLELLGEVGGFVSQSGAVVSSIMSGIAAISMLRATKVQSNSLQDAANGVSRANPMPVWVMNAASTESGGAVTPPMQGAATSAVIQGAGRSGARNMGRLTRLVRGPLGVATGGLALSSIPMLLEMASIKASDRNSEEQKEALKKTFSRNAWGMFGSAAGMAIGSVVGGPIGTAVGAALGGLAGDWVSGKREQAFSDDGQLKDFQRKNRERFEAAMSGGAYKYSEILEMRIGDGVAKERSLPQELGAVLHTQGELPNMIRFKGLLKELITQGVKAPAALAEMLPELLNAMDANPVLDQQYRPYIESYENNQGETLNVVHDEILASILGAASPEFGLSDSLKRNIETGKERDQRKYLVDVLQELSKWQFEQQRKKEDNVNPENSKQYDMLAEVREAVNVGNRKLEEIASIARSGGMVLGVKQR